MATESPSRPALTLDERRRRRDERRQQQAGQLALPGSDSGSAAGARPGRAAVTGTFVIILILAGAALLALAWQQTKGQPVILGAGVLAGLPIGFAAAQLTSGQRPDRVWKELAFILGTIILIAAPLWLWVLPLHAWTRWGLSAFGALLLVGGVAAAISLVASRKQSQAIEEAEGTQRASGMLPSLALICLLGVAGILLLVKAFPATKNAPIQAMAILIGLFLGGIATQAAFNAGNPARIRTLGISVFAAIPIIAIPFFLVVAPTHPSIAFAIASLGIACLVAAGRLTFALAPSISSAFENLRMQPVSSEGIRLEWAATIALLSAGTAVLLAVWHRQPDAFVLLDGIWAGLLLGALTTHSLLQSHETRWQQLAISLFAALPLIAIPTRYSVWLRGGWPLWGASLAGATLLACGLVLVFALRASIPSLATSRATVAPAIAVAGPAVQQWFHDQLLKLVAAFVLVLLALLAVIYGHEHQLQPATWLGFILVTLIGSVGLWTPGLHVRQKRLVAIRRIGQAAFWLGLLLFPFLEVTPPPRLPYLAAPTIRFISTGAGLLLIGITWFIQRGSIVAQPDALEQKHGIERFAALILALAGAASLALGAELRLHAQLRVDGTVVSQTSLQGSVTLEPVQQMHDLRIEQPSPYLPVYVNTVDFSDGAHFAIYSLIFPDQQGLTTALRTAGQLNTQSFPSTTVEMWSR